MGFISIIVRCFSCVDDEDQPSEEGPILFAEGYDAQLLSERSLSSSFSSDSCGDRSAEYVSITPPTCLNLCKDSVPKTALHDKTVLAFEECLEYRVDSSSSDSLHSEEPVEKNPDRCNLLEKLHFQEPIEQNEVVCLPEDLDSEDPIEDVEEKEEIDIRGVVIKQRWINHYCNFQKILLVGEGDFSFSASLGNAFGSAPNMIATSLNSREFLRNNYRRAISNIENLMSKGCNVIHGIDATTMANNSQLKGMKFDRIIFNFPFAGFFKSESTESQLSRHQQLVSLFLENAKQMMKEEGETHITHKTNGFHRKWKLVLLASRQGLGLIEAVHFNHRDYEGYKTQYGFGGDYFFNCNPSKTYKFRLL